MFRQGAAPVPGDTWGDASPLPDAPWPDVPCGDEPLPSTSDHLVVDDAPVVEELDPLDEVVRAARNRNMADAQLAFSVAQLLATTRPREAVSARSLVIAEIGPPLGLGSGAATKLVDTVIALASRLKATLDEVWSGRLSWYKATILAERTAALSDEQARLVESAVLVGAEAATPARFADRVRRAVDRIDPEGAEDRRRQAKKDVKLIRSHYGDGMGDLFARMAGEQLDTVWTAADMWARSRKADGDGRTVDQLRVASLVQWAQSYLHHGDPTYCDRWCTPGSHGVDDDAAHEDAKPPSAPPTRHGRVPALSALWDLQSLLGLATRCGELADSGAVLPPEAMRELVDGGVAIRRMLIDPDTGELLDLTPRTWRLPRVRETELDAPVVLGVILDGPTWRALRDGTAASELLAAVAAAPRPVRDLLEHPWTADSLDADPAAYPAPARLAEFVAVRDRHPVNPTAGPTAAAAADLDHTPSVREGGQTIREHLAAVVRRWHRLKTVGGWSVARDGRGWQWTSPRGRSYFTAPYDYRLGP